jgi:hypothetical protein
MSHDLEGRAAEQFEEYDGLRILFFFDAAEKHRDEVQQWSEDSIRCVVADDARFKLSHKLRYEWVDDAVFLYVPEERPADWSKEPLADLWVANRELRIDKVGEFMEEHQLPADKQDLVQRYYDGELEYKGRKQFLSQILQPGPFGKEDLQRGLAAYHAKEIFEGVKFRSVPQEPQLLAALIIGSTSRSAFEEYRETCEELDLADYLGRRLSNQFELDTTALSREAVETAAHTMKYNLLMRPVDTVRSEDHYRKLRIQSTLVLNQLESLKAAWEESGALQRDPEETLDAVASGIDETHLLKVYGPDTTFGYLTPALRRRRLTQALDTLEQKPGQTKTSVEDLRDGEGRLAQAAHVVRHMASFYQLLRGYPSMDFGELRSFIDAYSDELYQTDTHYRKAVQAYRQLEEAGSVPDLLREAYDRFLHHYHTRYVQPLNTAWQEALEADPEAVDALPITLQGQFYDEFLADEEQKTAVIVSDALRFEVAQQLSDRMLQADARKQTTVEPLLAALPTVTSTGKAHLLPHDTITFKGDTPRIDGQSTAGTRNRGKILQEPRSSSACARTYEDVKGLSQSEGRDLFKEHPLVYIFHDHIDAIGDQRKTEKETIPAIEETVSDLQKLVRTLNNWNVYRALLVADHGFLYMENDPPEAMQESFPEAEGRVLRGNRSIVAEHTGGEGGYRFPLRAMSDIDADLEVRVPKAVNRYKLQGAGKHYAHGGASLQEMLVPVLAVHKAREDKAKKVDVRLLSEDRVIRSGFLKVQILQTEAVSSNRQARTVYVGLYDGEELISKEKVLTLDSTAQEASERTQGVKLTLSQASNDLNFCHLRAYDEDDHDKLNPIVEQRYSIERLIEQDF